MKKLLAIVLALSLFAAIPAMAEENIKEYVTLMVLEDQFPALNRLGLLSMAVVFTADNSVRLDAYLDGERIGYSLLEKEDWCYDNGTLLVKASGHAFVTDEAFPLEKLQGNEK